MVILLSRAWIRRYAIAYAALALSLLAHARHYYHPHTGFSALVRFGDRYAPQRVGALRDVPLYTHADSAGYDGQFYAQLAAVGNPLHPELPGALDSAPYRSRRPLLPMLAHAAGLGRPGWAVQAYALSNLASWLLLAVLLARWWFPPTDLHNLLRWAGVLFGAGLASSVTRGLTDGPALLFLAAGVRLVERRRDFTGAVLLAAAGLVRDASALAAASLLPAGDRQDRRPWRALLAIAVCVLPVTAWTAFLAVYHGSLGSDRNFAPPFTALAAKVSEIIADARTFGIGRVMHDVLSLVAISTQVGFLLARPRVDQPWWRVGAAFSLLWVVLGPAVWEGTPSAMGRVVLPIALAFNVLAPRTRGGLVLLLAGNLTVVAAADVLAVRPSEQNVFVRGITLTRGEGWHGLEGAGATSWRWASGSGTLTLHNPGGDPVRVTLEFELGSVTDRTVTVRAPAGSPSFVLTGGPGRLPVRVGPFRLPPGETAIDLTSAEPAWLEPWDDGRALAFAAYDLYVTVDPEGGRGRD